MSTQQAGPQRRVHCLALRACHLASKSKIANPNPRFCDRRNCRPTIESSSFFFFLLIDDDIFIFSIHFRYPSPPCRHDRRGAQPPGARSWNLRTRKWQTRPRSPKTAEMISPLPRPQAPVDRAGRETRQNPQRQSQQHRPSVVEGDPRRASPKPHQSSNRARFLTRTRQQPPQRQQQHHQQPTMKTPR